MKCMKTRKFWGNMHEPEGLAHIMKMVKELPFRNMLFLRVQARSVKVIKSAAGASLFGAAQVIPIAGLGLPESMEILEYRWMIQKICGNPWKSVEVSGNLLKYVET